MKFSDGIAIGTRPQNSVSLLKLLVRKSYFIGGVVTIQSYFNGWSCSFFCVYILSRLIILKEAVGTVACSGNWQHQGEFKISLINHLWIISFAIYIIIILIYIYMFRSVTSVAVPLHGCAWLYAVFVLFMLQS